MILKTKAIILLNNRCMRRRMNKVLWDKNSFFGCLNNWLCSLIQGLSHLAGCKPPDDANLDLFSIWSTCCWRRPCWRSRRPRRRRPGWSRRTWSSRSPRWREAAPPNEGWLISVSGSRKAASSAGWCASRSHLKRHKSNFWLKLKTECNGWFQSGSKSSN